MHSYMYDKIFSGINFQKKKRIVGEFENCHFNECLFTRTDLTNVAFIECRFEDCNFSMAKISSTIFRDVRFKKCKLLGLSFEDCNQLLLSMYFEDCQLNLASFRKLDLSNTIFKNCSLHEADFTETNLTKAVFSNCDLTAALFQKTILKNTDLSTSYNFSIDPEVNQLKKAKFSLEEVPGLLDKYDIVIE